MACYQMLPFLMTMIFKRTILPIACLFRCSISHRVEWYLTVSLLQTGMTTVIISGYKAWS